MGIRLTNTKKKLTSLPRAVKRLIAAAVDTVLCLFSIWLAYFLRLGEFVYLSGHSLGVACLSVLIAIPIFWLLGLYNEIFRFSGWPVFIKVLRAVSLYSLFFICVVTIIGIQNVPRTIGLIQPLFLILLVSLSRLLVKNWLSPARYNSNNREKSERILIYGAGEAGQALFNLINQTKAQTIVGYVDDDTKLQEQQVNGKIVFAPSDLASVVQRKNIDCILLALPSVSRQRRNQILEQLKDIAVSVRTLPSLNDFTSGNISYSDIHELEIEDLLGREPVLPDVSLIQKDIRDMCVMVSGAGGSIGSELCRQIIENNPKILLLVEQSEYSLYEIHQSLLKRAEHLGVQLIPILSSVCDEPCMNRIMSNWRPNTVYHTAAYKHVPLVESNPIEGVRNNVLGTLVSVQTAIRNNVSNFVLISTDKAVRPTNIMGASKRVSELILQGLSREQSKTCLTMVRFGNVLGSSGSVVPKFRQQIRDGGPVSITHPDVTRYFMTTPEAAQLVLQSGALASGGDVFVLDMGEPVKIYELAKRMIELSGLKIRENDDSDGDIEIEIVGLRPGEKLYEELVIGQRLEKTTHPRIFKANEEWIEWLTLERILADLNCIIDSGDEKSLISLLSGIVSGYQPSMTAINKAVTKT